MEAATAGTALDVEHWRGATRWSWKEPGVFDGGGISAWDLDLDLVAR